MAGDRSDRGSFAGRFPHLPWEVGVGILAVAAACLAYFAARYALEVLIALVALGLLVALQRTVMDTLRDLFGANAVNLTLAAMALIGLWCVLGSDDGRRATGELLAAADRRGFKTLFVDVSGFEAPAPAVRVPPSSGGAAAAPEAAGARTASPSVRQPSLVGGRVAPAPRLAGGSGGSGSSGGGATTPGRSSGVATSGAARSSGGGDQSARPVTRQAATLRMRLMTPRPVAGEYVTVRVEAESGSDEAPGGSVELSIDGVALGSRSLDWWGRVDFTIQDLAAGSYSVSARLDSDAWAAPREAITVTVAPGAPVISN